MKPRGSWRRPQRSPRRTRSCRRQGREPGSTGTAPGPPRGTRGATRGTGGCTVGYPGLPQRHCPGQRAATGDQGAAKGPAPGWGYRGGEGSTPGNRGDCTGGCPGESEGPQQGNQEAAPGKQRGCKGITPGRGLPWRTGVAGSASESCTATLGRCTGGRTVGCNGTLWASPEVGTGTPRTPPGIGSGTPGRHRE